MIEKKPALSEYTSIASNSSAEVIVKKSKFIANASPAMSKAFAEKFASQISSRFQDATHNCFAYLLGLGDKAQFRFSDAGEPSGTAGKPILQAIQSKDLTDVVVVVTRYFGGTKLGTGGLIRAYHSTALQALNQAKGVTKFLEVELRLNFSYELTNVVQHLSKKYDAKILKSNFDQDTNYLLKLKAVDEPQFRSELLNATSGKIKIEKVEPCL